jgi:TolA-binding protein
MRSLIFISMLLMTFSGWAAKEVTLKPFGVKEKVAATATKKDRMVLSGVDAFGPGEKVAYAEIIQNYRKENLSQTVKSVEVLLKFYPKSVYADNALYLMGILYMKNNQMGPAIRSFDQVIKDYPKGNKRASAMFAKSIAYKNLSLNGNAKRYLQDVIKSYPGSVESQRAWVELRLMNKERG